LIVITTAGAGVSAMVGMLNADHPTKL
jgi:hypothetical protein